MRAEPREYWGGENSNRFELRSPGGREEGKHNRAFYAQKCRSGLKNSLRR